MLRSNKALRFTAIEVEQLRRVGLDVRGVRTAGDFAEALDPWIDALHEVRSDLLMRLVEHLAMAKGLKLPPRLHVVSLPESIDEATAADGAARMTLPASD